MDQLLVWSRRQRNLSQRFVFGDGLRLSESCLPNAIKPRMGETMRDMVTDNDNNLSALLCQLWREEERRLGVLRDSDGCISCEFSFTYLINFNFTSDPLYSCYYIVQGIKIMHFMVWNRRTGTKMYVEISCLEGGDNVVVLHVMASKKLNIAAATPFHCCL